MMEEWREPWQQQVWESLLCSDLLSVYVPIEVHPGHPQSFAGAT